MEKQISIVRCENCDEGVVVWDREDEVWICNKCNALYK